MSRNRDVSIDVSIIRVEEAEEVQDFNLMLQRIAREGFYVVTISPPYYRGRNRKLPLVMGPMIAAAGHSLSNALEQLIVHAKRRDCNSIYSLLYTVTPDGIVHMSGTPAIAPIDWMEIS